MRSMFGLAAAARDAGPEDPTAYALATLLTTKVGERRAASPPGGAVKP